MKLSLVILLQLFCINVFSQCDARSKFDKNLFDPTCCDEFSKLSSDSTHNSKLFYKFQKAKCLIWEKEYLKAIRSIEKLSVEIKTQIENSESKDLTITKLYFQTLILGFDLSKVSLDKFPRDKYQIELNKLICNDEILLIEHVENFIYNSENLKYKVEDVLSKFDFYLSYINPDNCNQVKADQLIKDLINRYSYEEIIFKPKTDKIQDRNFLFGGSMPNIEVYFRNIKYIIFLPNDINKEVFTSKDYQCDTITIFDYYPLEQWREPIFLSYYKKEGEDNLYFNIIQSIKLIEILK